MDWFFWMLLLMTMQCMLFYKIKYGAVNISWTLSKKLEES